jgi:hypothetical protein
MAENLLPPPTPITEKNRRNKMYKKVFVSQNSGIEKKF